MSLFGSLMGDLEDDPFFGSHMRSMRQMNEMMNSMFANPFGMFGMGPPAIGSSSERARNELMPFSFPNMNRMFEGYDRMGNVNVPNCHSFSSSTMMTMTNGPDGRPQVYQASSSTRTAPGGVKETKKTVCDSRSGVKKIAIGHHIGERAHVLEREQNLHSGDREERQEFINLEEEEAEDFNREFEHKTKHPVGAIGYSSSSSNRHARRHRELPALPSSSASSRLRSRSYLPSTYERRSYRPSPAPLSPSSGIPSPSHQERSRKRDHEPDEERKHKTLKPSEDEANL